MDTTYRLLDHILDRVASLATFSSIAMDTCQDAATIKDIFWNAFQFFDNDRGKDLPRVLGIDEVYINRKYYTVLVDGETGNVVDLMKKRRSEFVRQRLMEARNREAVEYITQDFSDSYRRASKAPIAGIGKKGQKKSSKSSREAELESTSAQLSFSDDLFAPEIGDCGEEEDSSRISKDDLLNLLPNAKTVGDHFHFKAAIVEDGFDAIRKHVGKSLRPSYFNRMLRFNARRQQGRLKGTGYSKTVTDKANEDVRRRAHELERKRFILFKHPKQLNDDEWKWLKTIFADHPLLKKGWEIKNSGLEIFPEKPQLGRSKKARAAAIAKRTALLLTEEEAARRLDDWVRLVTKDQAMEKFFGRALRIINNWREEVIRIGTTSYSNATAESKNHFVRMLANISRGLDFEMLRARLLWADANRRTKRWPDLFETEEGARSLAKFVRWAYDSIESNESNAHSESPDTSPCRALISSLDHSEAHPDSIHGEA